MTHSASVHRVDGCVKMLCQCVDLVQMNIVNNFHYITEFFAFDILQHNDIDGIIIVKSTILEVELITSIIPWNEWTLTSFELVVGIHFRCKMPRQKDRPRFINVEGRWSIWR